MSIQDEQELAHLKSVGRIVRQVIDAMKPRFVPASPPNTSTTSAPASCRITARNPLPAWSTNFPGSQLHQPE